jgi:hypothetical protein
MDVIGAKPTAPKREKPQKMNFLGIDPKLRNKPGIGAVPLPALVFFNPVFPVRNGPSTGL